MIYTRGARDDFDRFASHTSDRGWSWNALYPYILKNERLVVSADGHDTRGQVNPRVHGDGPLTVSLPSSANSLDGHIIQTTREKSGFEFNLDMNSGNTIGVGACNASIGKLKMEIDVFGV